MKEGPKHRERERWGLTEAQGAKYDTGAGAHSGLRFGDDLGVAERAHHPLGIGTIAVLAQRLVDDDSSGQMLLFLQLWLW